MGKTEQGEQMFSARKSRNCETLIEFNFTYRHLMGLTDCNLKTFLPSHNPQIVGGTVRLQLDNAPAVADISPAV